MNLLGSALACGNDASEGLPTCETRSLCRGSNLRKRDLQKIVSEIITCKYKCSKKKDSSLTFTVLILLRRYFVRVFVEEIHESLSHRGIPELFGYSSSIQMLVQLLL